MELSHGHDDYYFFENEFQPIIYSFDGKVFIQSNRTNPITVDDYIFINGINRNFYFIVQHPRKHFRISAFNFLENNLILKLKEENKIYEFEFIAEKNVVEVIQSLIQSDNSAMEIIT